MANSVLVTSSLLYRQSMINLRRICVAGFECFIRFYIFCLSVCLSVCLVSVTCLTNKRVYIVVRSLSSIHQYRLYETSLQFIKYIELKSLLLLSIPTIYSCTRTRIIITYVLFILDLYCRAGLSIPRVPEMRV